MGGQMDGIIFDKDGTLFDFKKTWAAWSAQLLETLSGGEPGLKAAMAEVIGYDLLQGDFLPDSVVIAGTPDEIAERLLSFLPAMRHDHLVQRMNLLAAEVPLVEAVPLRPLLEGLRAQGLRIGLATNDAEAPAHAHLNRVGVSDLFDFVVGCDSGFGAKPAPGQLLAFSAQMGLSPDRIAMVGDSLHDLHSAERAGMRRVAVLTGIAKAPALAPHADVVLRDIGELPAWLERVNG